MAIYNNDIDPNEIMWENQNNIKNKMVMTKYLKVDREECYGISVCDTKEEVIESCGFDVDEITFEDLCETMSGIYDIVEVTGDFQLKWLIKE